jgi:hypothetical protein
MSQGFDPVGSKPVDSLGSSGLVGTYFQPESSAPIILDGAGSPVANTSGIESAGLQRETLLATQGNIKSAGLQRETLLAKQGFIFSAGLVREVLRSGNSGPTGDNCSVCIIWG